MPSLNMCGFLYVGADVGGFGGNCDHELLIRWSQFAMFTPLLEIMPAWAQDTRNLMPMILGPLKP